MILRAPDFDRAVPAPRSSAVRLLTATDWPLPAGVRAAFTLRHPGPGAAPYDGFNLGHGVGDQRGAVTRNRRELRAMLALPQPPTWLHQVHGTRVVVAEAVRGPARADASVASSPGAVLAILTADCVPVLLCAHSGRTIAAAHAGWRGLAAGVLERTVEATGVAPPSLTAWLGPAIGPGAFEVGAEVRAAFVASDAAAAGAFTAAPSGRWLADLHALARARLAGVGVHAVFAAAGCTFQDRSRFFSYRRDGRTGRMATLIWRHE